MVAGDLDWTPGLESTAWLVTLALTSQVLGWLLISVSLPRLPAVITSIVLMLQPVSHGLPRRCTARRGALGRAAERRGSGAGRGGVCHGQAPGIGQGRRGLRLVRCFRRSPTLRSRSERSAGHRHADRRGDRDPEVRYGEGALRPPIRATTRATTPPIRATTPATSATRATPVTTRDRRLRRRRRARRLAQPSGSRWARSTPTPSSPTTGSASRS